MSGRNMGERNSQKPRILVVEDESHLAILIKFNLEREGWHVTTVGDGPSALKLYDDHEQPFDLIILDLMLPKMSGYAVCESLRERGYEVPILMLSARTLTEDRIRGFNAGTNQYLTKPFDLEELLSRVRNLLALRARAATAVSPGPSGPDYFQFDDAEIDFRTFDVKVKGDPVRLTHLEMKLLQYLIQHEGRVISRHELLEEVWNTSGHVTTRAVDQFILRLRKTFEPDPANPRYFRTIRDAGYRFTSSGE